MKSFPAIPSREEKLVRLIQSVSEGGRGRRSRLKLSIGDDAAALQIRDRHDLLVSTDALVEGVHFDLSYFRPEELGWKALAVNLSDIAAMGGRPLCFTTSIALPQSIDNQFVRRFYRGTMKLAREFGVELAGGDTCASRRGIFIDVTVLGEVKSSEMVGRNGARPGDLIFVSGELGGSAIGLEILRSSPRKKTSRGPLVNRHLQPVPRCQLGRFLARKRLATAMIDLSDGLSIDLYHLCSASRVGAVIEGPQIPLPCLTPAAASRLRNRPVNYALHGGEDYELLFTVPARLGPRVPVSLAGVPVRRIGIITEEPVRCYIRLNGFTRPLIPKGFNHFAAC